MGISIHGLMVNLKGEEVPELLSTLFKRDIVATKKQTWNWIAQFDMPANWDIAVFSKGENSALYFGDALFMITNRMFPDTSVAQIPCDYLYYSFVESSMSFVLSHKKQGSLSESYFTMDGEDYVQYGDQVLDLTTEDDIAQEGLARALAEFGIEPDDLTEVTVYSLSPELRKADSKDPNLRYFIGKSARELLKKIQEKDPKVNAYLLSVLQELNKREVKVNAVSLSNEDSKFRTEGWRKLLDEELDQLESELISQVIAQQESEKAFADLVYLYDYLETRKAKKGLFRGIQPLLLKLGLIGMTILLGYLYWKMRSGE
ncbi:MAG: hypothetical protein EP332_06050 [Bacteroidetes bacterium]|nr:MAG: hypothetical protein EP332_06050 [Bacteroidota bacterium]